MQHSVLISGAGSMGKRHARNLKELGIQNITICDPSEDARTVVVSELEVDTTDDFEQSLQRSPDIVFLCTPTRLHMEHALLAAGAGCHLFVEKPLSHSLDRVDELLSVIDEKNLITMVGCNMRFHFGPQKIKELIESKTIGDVLSARVRTASYLPRWRREVSYKESYSAHPNEGGAVLDCIHEIDVALWLFGSADVVGSATIPATSIDIPVEGAAEILLRHDSNVLSSIHLSFIQQDWIRSIEVVGTQGTIYWRLNRDFVTHTLEIYANDTEFKESYSAPENWDRNSMYTEEVKQFLQGVESGTQPMGSVQEGLEALKIALAVKN